MTEETNGHGTAPTPLIVIASNRGPFKFEPKTNGGFNRTRGTGGLVTALAALAERMDVMWIAAAISAGDKQWAAAQKDAVTEVDNIKLRLIDIPQKRYDEYYNQIANPLLWFIHHQLWDGINKPSFDKAMWMAWKSYEKVNTLFADAIATSVKQVIGDSERPVLIFPQDYQLHLVPGALREKVNGNVQIQPFLHIPFPGLDAWRVLPGQVRDAILHSLLASDRVGFQTKHDAFNFVQTARFYLDNAHAYGARDTIYYRDRKDQERKITAKVYPISIDVDKVEALVTAEETRLHKAQIVGMVGDRRLIMRTDRIEPSKNILRGLHAYRALLQEYPQYRNKVMMLALLVPSRLEVGEYQDYMGDVMAEAGMINADFSDGIWEPVRIIVGDNYARAIAAMQLYDILLVNPIADGMNLVAKEGVLVNQHDGVLILSEHAGAFYELGDNSLTVSPFDVYGTTNAIKAALEMPMPERQQRAAALRAIVKKAGIKEWFDPQVADALSALSSASNSVSTPATPSTAISADARTTSGVSAEKTPTPKA